MLTLLWMFDRSHLRRRQALDLGFLEVFKPHSQFQCLSLVCLYFLVLAGSGLVGCSPVRISPFPPGCHFMGRQWLLLVSYEICVSIASSCRHWFYWIESCPFCPRWVWLKSHVLMIHAVGAVTEKDKKKGEKKDLSILLDFSKNHLLVYWSSLLFPWSLRH